MVDDAPIQEPPGVLRLVGHPLRWRLLSELARSDRRVRELRSLLGEPQSLVSYHLGQLRAAGLVQTRRSTFDARDTYYRVDLVQCGELLAGVGGALHPGLRLVISPPRRRPRRRAARARVLFFCTGNSARSPMAAALVNHRAGDRVAATSAGSHPKPLHPGTVTVMRSYGIDLAGHRPRHLDELTGRPFDYLVSLCDRAREVCPGFTSQPETIHWSIPDPGRNGNTGPDADSTLRRTAAELETRIAFLVQLIDQARQPGGEPP